MKAIISGVTGQDGSYLSEFLLDKGYHVIGFSRRVSVNSLSRISHLLDHPKFLYLEGDVTDPNFITSLVLEHQPEEFYHLSAQSVCEDEILPIKSGKEVKYVTFKDLWKNQIKKGKKVESEFGVEVINLDGKQSIKALGYWNGKGNWFKIKQISRHYLKSKVAKLSQKFGQVTVTDNHSILDTNNQVCKPKDNPWLLNVRSLNYDHQVLDNVNLDCLYSKTKDKKYFWKEDKGVIGKVKKIVSGKDLEAFCRFIGAYVSEGWLVHNKTNDVYSVCICQNNKEWLEKLEKDLDRFFIGNRCYCKHKKSGFKDVWRLEIKSKALYQLMKKLCGQYSHEKYLPDWFATLKNRYKEELWKILKEGDGSNGCTDDGWRYGTTSYKLACQLGWLFSSLGFEYTVHHNDYEKNIRDFKPIWNFRSCRTYSFKQGEKSKKIKYIDYEGYVYDISVEEVSNFTVGVGNIVVHNSHVGTSFKQPDSTFQINAQGTLNVLNAIKSFSKHTRMYNAATSELWGSNYRIDNQGKKIQDLTVEFRPNSPYAVAKLAAFHSVRLYRESYDLFCCSGVLHNHETISYGTPLICKIDNEIDILPVGDIARFKTGVEFDLNNQNYQEGKPTNILQVWDKEGWVDVSWVSGYPHLGDKNPRIINSRNSVFNATGSHVCIMNDDSEKQTSDLEVGDKVKLLEYPEVDKNSDLSLEYAEWLGMLVGDGNLNRNIPRLGNKNVELLKRFEYLWSCFTKNYRSKIGHSYSGFTGEQIDYIQLYSDDKFEYDVYTQDISPFGHKNKKVPKCILNADLDVMEAFLIGYNNCDGLKSGCGVYRFKNFKTNSMTLAAGLIFLVSKVTGQKYNITVEESWAHGKQQFYYSINLLSDRKNSITKYHEVKSLLDQGIAQRKIHRETGISRSFIKKVKNGYKPQNTHPMERCNKEIKKIIDIPNYNGWFFDLETSSGTFHAGIGQGLVHNSPRRGEQFVTRKITKWLGEFCRWKDEIDNQQLDITDSNFLFKRFPHGSVASQFPKLRLGNVDAYRDWGHSNCYVKAMWMMLQSEPKDYVVATGEAHSVRDFLKEAFKCIGIDNYEDYYVVDPEFFRPCEVPYLCGNAAEIQNDLGWKPEVKFNKLVKMMVDNDQKL